MTSSRTATYVAVVKVPLTILGLFAAAVAAYYFLYVTSHQTYLVERNFRLLATMGDEIAATLDSDQRVIDSMLVGNFDVEGSRFVDWSVARPRIQPRAAGFVPFLRHADLDIGKWSATNQKLAIALMEPGSTTAWMRRADAAADGVGQRAGFVRIPLGDVLTPLVGDEAGTGVFDAVIVATPDGRVVYQAGDSTLRIAHLGRLTERADAKPGERPFERLALAPSMTDVTVSGASYKLFTQPCCAQMVTAPAAATPSGDGWVLCGLVADRSLSSASYAVPFGSLVVLSLLLLAGLLSWPFLKLALIGEGQRVRAQDVVLVAISTLLAASLLTVGILDYFAYGRQLESALDGQLREFARDVDEQASREVASATEQLSRLEREVGALPAGHPINLAGTRSLFDGNVLDAYPFFDSFALVDADGRQGEKLTLGSVGTLFIAVSDREYFTHWMSSPRRPRPFLESIRSATTGAREAVVSKASTIAPYRVAALSIPFHALINPVVVPGFGFVVIDDTGDVLFHSDPQHSLSENFFVEADRNRRLRALVAARHAEAVDIQYWGDDHRALVFPMSVGQAWTLITFYDKNLIRTINVEWLVLTLALLMLHIGAYVVLALVILFLRPGYRAPWLWPDPARSPQYLALVPPLLLLLVAFVLAVLVLPSAALISTAFLMPVLAWLLSYDALSRRVTDVRVRWATVAALLVAGVLAIVVFRAEQAAMGAALALLCVAPPLLMLRARRAGTATGSRASVPLALPVSLSFGLTACLCLALTAVLPAAAFFRVGHGLQLESFVKYGQLQVALDRIEDLDKDAAFKAKQVNALLDENQYARWRGQAADRLRQALDARMDQGVYQRFFFSTEDVSASACAGNGSTEEARSARPSSEQTGLELLEELLPFYSESSVHLRELVHDQAADTSWTWRRTGSDVTFCAQNGVVAPFKSTVPRLFAAGPLGVAAGVGGILWLGAIALVAAAIAWLVRFALHRVFVIDAIEPLWSGSAGSLEQFWGPHLFLVSHKAITDAPRAASYCDADLAEAPEDPVARAAWFASTTERILTAPPDQSVLLRHFEHDVQDPAENERKLQLLERLVTDSTHPIVVVSSVPPGRFTAGAVVAASSREGEPALGVPTGVNAADWIRRWAAVLSKFTVVPVTPAPAGAPAEKSGNFAGWLSGSWREMLWRINALGFSYSAQFLEDERRDPVAERLWKDVLPYAWHPDRPALTMSQLLVEVGERSESHYRELWDTCTPAEKVVLGQIAEEGLVNQKTQQTLRMLLARGLVRRRPNFVLLNETFRQFVLSTASRAEVTALEDTTRSTWDVIRWPLLILLGGSVIFFFATQHEMFNTALGLVTGLAAVLPALMKVASLFGDRKQVR